MAYDETTTTAQRLALAFGLPQSSVNRVVAANKTKIVADDEKVFEWKSTDKRARYSNNAHQGFFSLADIARTTSLDVEELKEKLAEQGELKTESGKFVPTLRRAWKFESEEN